MHKKRVLSCIQPTGDIHLGNYLGAVRNWVALQDTYDCVFGIVDYHAITGNVRGADLRERTLDMAKDLLACGIDPKKSILFVQSHVPEHTELCWVLNAVTAYGDLTRMTQFKAKAAETDFVNAGLFNYPVLQAADILIYKAEKVPVGEDQRQHIELAREIARKFNSIYGEVFVEPGILTTDAASIRSLADPERKMSKSFGEHHYIGLRESPQQIEAKVKQAVTDSGSTESVGMSPGVENLFTILHAIAQPQAEALEREYHEGTLQYSKLKTTVSQAILRELAPVRKAREALDQDPGYVAETLRAGARAAREIAAATMSEVRRRVGVGPREGNGEP